MEHTYLIYANHKERIQNPVELIHGLNGFGAAKFEDMTLVSTSDDELAGILDKLLGPYDVKTASETKAKDKQPVSTDLPAKPPKNKKREKLEKRECTNCHILYQPRMKSQKLCPDCSREKNPWAYHDRIVAEVSQAQN